MATTNVLDLSPSTKGSVDKWIALLVATQAITSKMGTSFYLKDPTGTIIHDAERVIQWIDGSHVSPAMDEDEEEECGKRIMARIKGSGD